jgi:hypothetical protein
MKNIIVLIVVLNLVSCSTFSKKVKPKTDYKVSVEANGKKVSGETERLVNRVTLSESQIIAIFGTILRPKIPPEFLDKSTNSKNSKVIVGKDTKFTKALGLRYGDVITSIETDLIMEKADLKLFAELFSKQTEVGLDFQRGSKIMKIILYKSK